MTDHKVHILPETVANLIAAGEVVERPASVVKELLENSLDADASNIEIEIKDSGITYIRITDDGYGMLPHDAELAFSRHATSKINLAEDLENISTFGFRGEALPSIASVSRVHLLTCQKNELSGFSIKIEGGSVRERQEAGCPSGTSIVVEDLFYNTPARKKFLKTPATELSRIIQVIEATALAHPQVRFKVLVDNKTSLNCPAVTSLADRIFSLYGNTVPGDLLALEKEGGGIWLRGLIAGQQVHKNSRQGMHFFINQRPVEHRGLAHAVIQAFHSLIPENRFPVCFLFLEMPKHLVDVNVHPSKREVRLRDEHGIHHFVQTAIQDVLKNSVLNGKSSQNEDQPILSNKNIFHHYDLQKPLPYSADRVRESIGSYIKRSENHDEKTENRSRMITPTAAQDENEEETAKGLRIIGQVGTTYIAAQDSEGFFLMDQHAAHERVLFEKFKQWPAKAPRQALLLPLTFEIKPSHSAWLQENLQCLNNIGIELSLFGNNTYIIQTQPILLPPANLIEIVMEIVEWAAESGNDQNLNPDHVHIKLLESMACKAAVKAGMRLQPEQMLSLIQDIQALDSMPTCPHGRPIFYRISWKALDKIFKRDYA